MQANALWPVESRFPKLEKDISVDVLVVGGGIAGVSSAYHLKKAGYNVALIEAEEIGSAATGASSGVLYYGSGTNFIPAINLFGESLATNLWKETAKVIDEIVSLAEDKQIECGLRKCGAIMAARTKEQAHELEKEQAALSIIGIKTRLLSGKDISESYIAQSFVSGLAFDGVAQIHPALFANGLAKKEGLAVYENSPLESWDESDYMVTAHTPDATIKASKMVIATNLKPLFDLEQHYGVENSVILASEPTPATDRIWKKEKIIWTMEEKYDIIYPRGMRSVLELYDLSGAEEKISLYYPGIDFSNRKEWGDSWAKTSDFRPIVGKMGKNTHVAIAMGDQGIIMGWLSGKNIVDSIKGNKNWFLDFADPKRFS